MVRKEGGKIILKRRIIDNDYEDDESFTEDKLNKIISKNIFRNP